MTMITPPERRALRAKAHHLQPVVSVGQHGLTPGVLHEIDINLRAHELIKIRVFSDDRARREAMLERICAELGAAAVQHLGKLLIVWRPKPQEPAPEVATMLREQRSAPTRQARPRGRPGKPKAAPRPAQSKDSTAMAKSAPKARRPRTPMARTTVRPPRSNVRGTSAPALPGGPRRRRRTGPKS